MTKNTDSLMHWQFKNPKDNNWLETTIPSTIHMDLYKKNIIPHPYNEQNEKSLQWIDKENWEYKTLFEIDQATYDKDYIEVKFDGIDTISTVYINNQLVLETDNMFRIWKCDIKPYISIGKNEIKVVLHSPVLYGKQELDDSEYVLPATMDESEMGGIDDKKVSMFIRKAPYHFGWDWGPRFATSGLWRQVTIESWSSFIIEDLYVQQESISSEKAETILKGSIRSVGSQKIELTVNVNQQPVKETIQIKKGSNSFSLPITINSPELWWTHDLGEQSFTTFYVNAKSDTNSECNTSVKTGLRCIELIQDEDSKGTSFYFKLNGIPVFIKGANHIPLDNFTPSVSNERYQTEIKHAKDANMNMIRVWGGGIYEEDIFYDLCDEQGILVWQDFMFANSMYPGNQAFLDNISLEAEDNIKRLRNHPSIAIWCGNNEIDSMWKEFTDKTYLKWKEAYPSDIRQKIWKTYDTIFHKMLPEKLKTLYPVANYWPSSPMAELSYSESQHASLNEHKGDIHLWNVWHSNTDIEEYNNNVGRFMSEYGFQSFPSLETYETISDDKSLTLDSEVVTFHQKNKSGNTILLNYLKRYYKLPKNFESFIYLSQSLQGYAFDTAIRAHRRAMPYCMGTLYWQLNDVWPGASWSTIDYYGDKKLSHYNVKEAYKSTIIYYRDTEKAIELYGITDKLADQDLTLNFKLYSLKNETTLTKEQVSVTLKQNNSTLLHTLNKDKLFDETSMNETLLYFELVDNEQRLVDSYILNFIPLKDINLNKPVITYTTTINNNTVCYSLKSNVYAKSVVLKLDMEGDFAENFIDILPDSEKKITFISNNTIDPSTLPPLNITSMIDYIK